MANDRAEESTPEGRSAAESRNTAGARTTGGSSEPAEGVLTQVCVKCGEEYHYEDAEPPESMTCGKCGGTVFRSFFTPEGDEAAADFDDSTGRDLDPDDAEGDTQPGDVMDLNRD